jgi:hypothetical protein
MVEKAAVVFLVWALLAPAKALADSASSASRTRDRTDSRAVPRSAAPRSPASRFAARAKPRSRLGPITPDGMDRVRLGMTTEQLTAAYGTRVRKTTLRMEETPMPGFEVSNPEGRLLLQVMAEKGRVVWIATRSPRLATARGARVGTRLKSLEALYGRGRVEEGEGVSVEFPRSLRGITFRLNQDEIRYQGSAPLTWDRLRLSNPRVEVILVTAAD